MTDLNVTSDDSGFTGEIAPDTPIFLGTDVATGETVELPVADVLTGRAFVTGKSGSGKSNTANVVAEELLERGFALLIIDKEGEYYGLKEQYELLHAGGDDECDIQVGPEHGEKLATLALEENVPIILDVSGYFDDEEGDQLILETVRHLFALEKKKKKPFLIIAEEAHEYIPEKGSRSELAKMMVRIGKRGRKRGLGLFAISQRPQDIQKSYISQCDWLVWHRLTWDTETKVVRRVIDSDTAESITGLEDGEGFVQADFLDADLLRVQIKRMRTFDAGETPGLEGFDRPELKSVSDDLVDELSEISERSDRRQDRIEQLESQLENKNDRIEELEDRVERLRDLREMVETMDGIDIGTASPDSITVEIDGEQMRDPETIRAEVLEIQQENQTLHQQIEDLRSQRDQLELQLQSRDERIDELEAQIEDLQWIESHVDEIEEAARRLSRIAGLEVDDQPTERLQQLKDERDELAARVEELESGSQNVSNSQEDPIIDCSDDDLERILSHPVIKEEWSLTVEDGDYSEDNYERVLSLIVTTEEAVSPQNIAQVLSVSDTTTRDICKDLRMNGFLQSQGDRPEQFVLDRDRLEKRYEIAEAR